MNLPIGYVPRSQFANVAAGAGGGGVFLWLKNAGNHVRVFRTLPKSLNMETPQDNVPEYVRFASLLSLHAEPCQLGNPQPTAIHPLPGPCGSWTSLPVRHPIRRMWPRAFYRPGTRV